MTCNNFQNARDFEFAKAGVMAMIYREYEKIQEYIENHDGEVDFETDYEIQILEKLVYWLERTTKEEV